jgi:hypothetical protein
MQLTDMSNERWQRRAMRCAGLLSVFILGCTASLQPCIAADLPELPEPLRAKVELAAQACKAFENGEFGLEWSAVEKVDLDGDLYPDWVLNESAFACSTAASLYCGTGGCMSHFLIGDQVYSLLNTGWDIVTSGRDRVVLAHVHGSRCGGINPTPCVTASVWDGEEKIWRSAAAEWE